MELNNYNHVTFCNTVYNLTNFPDKYTILIHDSILDYISSFLLILLL